MKKTRFCISAGHESAVAERIKEINSIIKSNTGTSIKEVVGKIAGVSMGSWYNYFSKGPLLGKISNLTVAELHRFFSLPEDIFSGKGEFSNEHHEAIVAKIKEVFGTRQIPKRGRKLKAGLIVKNVKPKKARPEKRNKTMVSSKPISAKSTRNVESIIKTLSNEIETLKDSGQLIKLADALDKLAYLALKKIDFCEALNEL